MLYIWCAVIAACMGGQRRRWNFYHENMTFTWILLRRLTASNTDSLNTDNQSGGYGWVFGERDSEKSCCYSWPYACNFAFPVSTSIRFFSLFNITEFWCEKLYKFWYLKLQNGIYHSSKFVYTRLTLRVHKRHTGKLTNRAPTTTKINDSQFLSQFEISNLGVSCCKTWRCW